MARRHDVPPSPNHTGGLTFVERPFARVSKVNSTIRKGHEPQDADIER
ncbi:MAG: hypothetical protein ABIR10_13175 [Dokdonella sp.]